jgi:uncharacterized protein YdaU (DUF1376 family)
MKIHWMPLYVADYRNKTTHLNAQQHGAYLLLIMHYWTHGRLPADDEQLARIAAVRDAEWKKIKPIIAAFFGPEWTHARIDDELAKAQIKSDKRAEAGARGGKANASKRVAIASDLPQQTNEHGSSILHSHSSYPSQELETSQDRYPQPSNGSGDVDRAKVVSLARGGLAS